MNTKLARKQLVRTPNLVVAVLILTIISACTLVTAVPNSIPKATMISNPPTDEAIMDIFKKPLVTNMYTADPSAHVFEGRIYIYPSHDLDHNNPPPGNNEGDQFDMEDYHVFSMDNVHMFPVDHGEVLNVRNVPWASMQMWAPDAVFKNGTYYLYFPARDQNHIFRIGVARSNSPAGPFAPEPSYIAGSFSIDPCIFVDDDGQAYMIFGGLWGGQLEKWKTGKFDPNGQEPRSNEPALGPRIAKLSADMLSFDGPAQEISILDEYKTPILAGEGEKRFFEASWMHKYNGVYYFLIPLVQAVELPTLPVTDRLALSFLKAISLILSWAGPRIIRSSNFRGNGFSSIMTPPFKEALITSAISKLPS